MAPRPAGPVGTPSPLIDWLKSGRRGMPPPRPGAEPGRGIFHHADRSRQAEVHTTTRIWVAGARHPGNRTSRHELGQRLGLVEAAAPARQWALAVTRIHQGQNPGGYSDGKLPHATNVSDSRPHPAMRAVLDTDGAPRIPGRRTRPSSSAMPALRSVDGARTARHRGVRRRRSTVDRCGPSQRQPGERHADPGERRQCEHQPYSPRPKLSSGITHQPTEETRTWSNPVLAP